MHEARVCRTRSASRLSRLRAGFPRSEGSGAKFEVYSGRATAARALGAELEDVRYGPRRNSERRDYARLHVSVRRVMRQIASM